MALVYKADRARGVQWKALLATKSPDLAFHVWPETGDLAAVRYLATWVPPDDIMGTFPNLELVMSIGAGVDHSPDATELDDADAARHERRFQGA